MKTITYLVTWVCLTTCFSQEKEFQRILSDIQANIKPVQTSKEEVEQNIEWIEKSLIRYSFVATSTKGKKREASFEFNVADLDEYLVREETKKDAIYLNIVIDNEEKFIKEYSNGVVKGYSNSFTILTSDIDNARTLKELFKQAIPVAQKIPRDVDELSNYKAMEVWLNETISDANLGNKSITQKLEPLDDPGAFKFTQTTTTSKGAETKDFYFNLGDVDTNSLTFTISGNSLLVSFEAIRKLKIFNLYEENIPAGYVNRISIYANQVEEAKSIKKALSMAVPLASEIVESSIKHYNQFKPAMNRFTELVRTIEYESKTLEQTIDGECSLRYMGTVITPKEKSRFFDDFTFLDIDEKSIDFGVSGDEMFVSMTTDASIDLIKSYERDDFKGYKDEVKIYVENIEDARRMKAVLMDLTRICKENYVDPFIGMSQEKRIKWLETNLGELMIGSTGIKQQFTHLADEGVGKMRLEKETRTSKSVKEELFEFNLKDVDPKSIQYKISGKSLSIQFETQQKEAIIKYYKNGEVDKYQYGFTLDLIDTEKARNVISAFNQIINTLNQ